MADPARTGVLVYAKDLQVVSCFYEHVLGATMMHADAEHAVLQSPDTQLIIHAIPPQFASAIDIAVPPVAREEQAIKPFFTVADLAEAERVAEAFGGTVLGAIWPAPGMRVRNVCDPEGNIVHLREIAARDLSDRGEAMSDVRSPREVAAELTELWSPRVVAEVDDVYVKVAKLHGVFGWHAHQGEDELFLVLKGHLRIEMEHAVVELSEGKMYVVPKGVRHNPVAAQECHVMLIEKKSTLHSGDVINEHTRSLAEQLRPL